MWSFAAKVLTVAAAFESILFCVVSAGVVCRLKIEVFLHPIADERTEKQAHKKAIKTTTMV